MDEHKKLKAEDAEVIFDEDGEFSPHALAVLLQVIIKRINELT